MVLASASKILHHKRALSMKTHARLSCKIAEADVVSFRPPFIQSLRAFRRVRLGGRGVDGSMGGGVEGLRGRRGRGVEAQDGP